MNNEELSGSILTITRFHHSVWGFAPTDHFQTMSATSRTLLLKILNKSEKQYSFTITTFILLITLEQNLMLRMTVLKNIMPFKKCRMLMANSWFVRTSDISFWDHLIQFDHDSFYTVTNCKLKQYLGKQPATTLHTTVMPAERHTTNQMAFVVDK